MGTEPLDPWLKTSLDRAASLCADNHHADAMPMYNEAIAILRKTGSQRNLMECLVDRARCHYMLRHFADAVRDYDEALRYHRKNGSPDDQITCMMQRALCLAEQGQTKNAFMGYDEALAVFRQHNMRGDWHARCVMYRAHMLYDLDRAQEAIAGYNAAIPLLRESGQFAHLAHSLHNRANSFYMLGMREDALSDWDEAVPLFRRYGPHHFMDECLTNRSTCLGQMGQFDKALEDIDEVLPILEARGAFDRVSRCILMRALSFDQMGRLGEAVRAYDDALAIYREHGTREELATCKMVRASCLRRLGHPVEALAGFDEILFEYQNSGLSQNDYAYCVMQKGICSLALGRNDEALAHLNRSLLIFREYGSSGELADCLMNRAVCLHFSGQQEEALQEFDNAARMYRENGALADLSQCLMNRASCLNSLFRWEDALAAHDEALALLREYGDPLNVAGCLLNRSNCVRHSGQDEDIEKAVEGLEEALEIFRERGTLADVAQCLMSRATCLGLLGTSEEVLDGYRAALPLLREHGRPEDLAGCLMNEGIVLTVLGEDEDALRSFNMALPIFEAHGTAGDTAMCMMQRASCLASLELIEKALSGFDEAFAVEDRASTVLQDTDHRILTRERSTDRHRQATRLAFQQGQLERAWAYVQRGKGRTLLDLLHVRAEFTALDRQEALLTQQREAGRIDQNAFATAHKHIEDQREARRTARLGKDPWIPMSLDDVTAALHPSEVFLDVFTTDNDGSLALFLLRSGEPSVSWVGAVDGPMLHPLVDRWQAARTAWNTAVNAKAWNSKVLSSIDPNIIDRRHTLLISGDHDARMDAALAEESQVLAELGELVFAPVLEQLDASVTTLIVSPDGLLYRLPLNAVRVPTTNGDQRALLDRLDLQVVPSATSLAILRGPNGPKMTWPAALLAAAPFATDDPHGAKRSRGAVSAGSQGRWHRFRSLWERTPAHKTRAMEQPMVRKSDSPIAPVPTVRELVRGGESPDDLPNSGPEIDTVSALLTSAGGTSLPVLRQEATRARLEEMIPAAHILHLATHGGALEPDETVMDYRIFLAGDSEIRVRELYEGDVPLKDVFLVNLSACSLGQVVLQGAEASGFVQAFLQAGAGVVLAPLWVVNDHATKELMVRFYEELTTEQRPTVAHAWRRATQRLRTETDYTHPVYWAGFLPSGDAALRLPTSA